MQIQDEVKKFFMILEDEAVAEQLISDRMSLQLTKSIYKQAKLLAKARKHVGVSVKSVIYSSFVLGYLLKSYLDRQILEESFKNSSELL